MMPAPFAAVVRMFAKIVIVVLLLAIVSSLMASMVFLVKDSSSRRRTLTGLKVRIILSITLLAFVLLSYRMGWIQPHPGPLQQPPAATSPP